ncbi:MAG: hypothetical protein EAZ12_08485 [Sphingobacteriia bacterium]|nr:MAG: hypothetical protein EAZ12_08485 [Sphingobacteriia bacterium]
MKKHILLFFFILSTASSFSQTEKPIYKHFEKGNSIIGIGFSPVYSDLFGTTTEISIQDGSSSVGLLLSPSYGKFIEKNWMVGGMGFLGYYSSRYSYNYYPPSIGLNPPFFPAKNISNYFDIGIIPFTRYYFMLSKRNTLAFFLQGGLPIVYGQTNYIQRIDFPSGQQDISSKQSSLTLKASLGFGLSVQGKFGSIDTHVSNLGCFFSFNKLLKSNKKA